MLQNNTFETRILSKRINRFKNAEFIDEEYKTFNFNNNLKSNHLEELEFTNYVSSNKCKKYLKLLDICKRIVNNEKEWDKLFIADEIDIRKEIPKIDRIYNIINAVNGKEINRQEDILKFKNLDDKAIQFYVRNEKQILTLYLIDLYHIGIEGRDEKTGRIDRKGIYRANKDNKYDIIEIEKEINKVDKP